MSYPQSRTYDLNTGITALPESGESDDAAHAATVKPLFKRIKGHDGIIACYIDRFTIEVKFMPSVLTEDQVYEIVSSEVTWAASQPEHEYFPQRGNKTPMAIAHAKPAPAHEAKIIAKFNTHVVAFPPSSTKPGDEDLEKFACDTHELASALTNLDGVVGYRITLQRAWLIIDTRYVDVETARRHMRDVLSGAKGAMDGVFPYIESGEQLVLTFSIQ